MRIFTSFFINIYCSAHLIHFNHIREVNILKELEPTALAVLWPGHCIIEAEPILTRSYRITPSSWITSQMYRYYEQRAAPHWYIPPIFSLTPNQTGSLPCALGFHGTPGNACTNIPTFFLFRLTVYMWILYHACNARSVGTTLELA